MANVIVPGRKLWAAEIREAKNLGFKLMVSVGDTAASAHLVPESRRAKAAAKAANGTAIEANQVIPPVSAKERPTAALEALRDAIHSALVMAKDAA
ncbi:MAG TPA: hypothetical protein VEW07_06305 [Solirubrobacterales bacterium]|nr:hypothetical protein [Solirubrobacterales bacterium]